MENKLISLPFLIKAMWKFNHDDTAADIDDATEDEALTTMQCALLEFFIAKL